MQCVSALKPSSGLKNTVDLGYNAIKGDEYFVLITEVYNITVNSEELIGATGYLSL
jgi:hypothetical protein